MSFALKKNIFLNLFLFVWARSLLLHRSYWSCSEWGYALVAVYGLLTMVAPLVLELRL